MDDEPEILELVSELKSSEGRKVDLAKGGEEAWAKVQGANCDHIFLDLKVPGMAGKVIFITGDTLNPDSEAFFASTGNLSLARPFTAAQLLDVLED